MNVNCRPASPFPLFVISLLAAALHLLNPWPVANAVTDCVRLHCEYANNIFRLKYIKKLLHVQKIVPFHIRLRTGCGIMAPQEL